ncbi:MAG: AAA domain-containing protein [Paludibacteraceae bacterium]|nr:AAA domain-containing protein [Paludibacteraceae bacterium]
MSTLRTFIIIKGVPKALQIEKIFQHDNNVYDVKFKGSNTTFHYRNSDIVWLKNAVWHDPLQCKVFIGGREKTDISDIHSFPHGECIHWRITFSNGNVKDYLHGSICVVESCLANDVAKNSFEYLKRVALTNELGKDEDKGGILPALYQNINFIDEKLVIAPYLDPTKYVVRSIETPLLIFPFGCNSSQEKAVVAAFTNQLSVIQGPPGTGKTQTILNIIANIILQGKTVMVVSNNNSATDNVLEKLQKYGFGFVVAPLGKRENKENFIKNQPQIPSELLQWKIDREECIKKKKRIDKTLSQLCKVYELQESLATYKQELKDLNLEWLHFKTDNNIDENNYPAKPNVKSNKLMSLWLGFQAYTERYDIVHGDLFQRSVAKIKWLWLNLNRLCLLGKSFVFDYENINSIILELQTLCYLAMISELQSKIKVLEEKLDAVDAKLLSDDLVSVSMDLLKGELYDKYYDKKRVVYGNVSELKQKTDDFLSNYPVVLSTTFSARVALSVTTVYDYVIMDEASQVSVETGALAMMCAKNAVIVGDSFQLPNVVTADDKLKIDAIFSEYNVLQGYNSSEYSFLQSVCAVIPNVKQTLLREHYRCHPKIINFCNQKFYGGKLLIMTEDNNEQDVMKVIKTVPGNHCRGHYNQREIDVVVNEILPSHSNTKNLGIITPYNSQVEAFKQQTSFVEVATVHKYQGREMDTIVMSTVDDQITEFSDDPNLLNVAVSRAKSQFYIVLSGNEQKLKGNISDLVDYISYNNFTVTDSKISSIFDYLYSYYTEQRVEYMANSKQISEYDSENLMYRLLSDIIAENREFMHLGILCHTPIRNILRDWSLMNEKEKCYVSHYATHVDFLIVNHVTKKPVLAIEIDGYNYHNDTTEQHQRDLMKNHILEIYNIPLLRLSTTGSGEREKIVYFTHLALGQMSWMASQI